MTLMVFDIKLPAPTQTTPWSLHYELIRLWPRFLAYTISFIMLDVYWVHRRTDRGFLWINVFFLMGVSLLPFSTGLLGQYPAYAPHWKWSGWPNIESRWVRLSRLSQFAFPWWAKD